MIYIRVVGERVRRSLVAGLATVAAVLAGCGGPSEPAVRTATLPQGTTTTNPYAVPPVIDEAYVNRVLAGLDKAFGDITRIVVETRTIPPEVIQRLDAMYVGGLVQFQIDVFQFKLLRGLKGYKRPPGDPHSIVTNLISVQPNCVFAQISKDASLVVESFDVQFSNLWIALVPADPMLDPNEFNPTPWSLLYEGFLSDLSQPEDPCRSVG